METELQERDDQNENSQETLAASQEVETPIELEETIGEYLKDIREAKNISLNVISKRTRINLKVLQDIEANNIDELPSRTYLRGFVKSYAKEIEADAAKSMILLDRLLNEDIDTQDQAIESSILNQDIEKLDDVGDSTHKVFNKKVGIIAAGLVGSIALLYGLYVLFAKANESVSEQIEVKSPEVKTEVEVQPEVATKEEAPTKSEEVEAKEVEPKPVEKKAEIVKRPEPKKVEKKETPKAEQKTAKKEDKKETKKEVKKDDNKEKVEFTKIVGPLYGLNGNSPKLNDPKILPANIKASFQKGKQNVFVNAVNDSTWLTYKNSDQAIKSFVLKKGRTLLIRGDEVRLFLGNLSAVEVIYNGKLVEATSTSGVKSLIFPETSIKKFSLPLFIYDKYHGKFFTEEEYKERNN